MVSADVRNVYPSGGPTISAYNKSGSKLLVTGESGVIRVYNTSSDDDDEEPDIFDIVETPTDLAVLDNDLFAVSGVNGEVDLYSISRKGKVRTLIRSQLPVRSIVFTHAGSMIAGAGDDDMVQICPVNEDDDRPVIKLKPGDQVHDLSYNKSTDLLTLSLVNGDVKFYSLTLEEPKLVKTLSGEVPSLIYQDEDEEAEDNILTARIEWHPIGDDFALPTDSQAIKVYSRTQDFGLSYAFGREHDTRLTALAWSPSGDYIASADMSNRLIVWNSDTRGIEVDETFDGRVTNIAWTKNNNRSYDLVCGSDSGNAIILNNVVKQSGVIPNTKQRASDNALNSEDEEEANGDDINPLSDISEDDDDNAEGMNGFIADDDLFLDDDDNAGYAEGGSYAIASKRASTEEASEDGRIVKRPALRPAFALAQPTFKLKPYNPGCTPYISDRRYLTMNSTGYISSVKQDTYSSVTVSFFDQSMHREYHFDDMYGYDLAGLTEQGLILGISGESKSRQSGLITFRRHDDSSSSWEKTIPLRTGEIITSLAISESAVVVGTSLGYVRTFDLFGTPQSLEKMSPVFAIITSQNYNFMITLSNGSHLLYSLKDMDGRYLQKDLTLPLELPPKGEELLNGIFFNTHGDPVLIGSDGVVLILTRWRNPLQATWVPILDSELKIKEIGGRGELSIWPLGLNREKLNCILVRGSRKYPNYPLPLPTELDVRLPLTNGDSATPLDEAEEELVRFKTMGELLGECLSNEGATLEEDQEVLEGYAASYDKSLLKLFSQACIDEKKNKAWQIVHYLKQDRALSAAAKMAERVHMNDLVRKINQLIEQRMVNEYE